MTHQRVTTPLRNYVENEDDPVFFEIGEEDIETPGKKKIPDDHAGYGFEEDSEDEGEVEPEELDEFSEFDWGDEEGEEDEF